MPDTIPLHRCRFPTWSPSPITSLALPPRALPSLRSSTKGKHPEREILPSFLAIGRANGDIELLQWAGEGCAQAWVPRQTLAGPVGSKVSTLTFTLRRPQVRALTPYDTPALDDLRLFSTTGGTDLLEWDLRTGAVCRTLTSQGGSIWSVAANADGSMLALGCEDGGVRIVSLRDGELVLARRLERVKARLLSLAWGPPTPARLTETDASEDEEDDEWEDTFLLAGCSDSSVRKWDIGSGRCVERWTTDKIRDEPTLVWAVGVLTAGTAVSGDSMGNVKFWDVGTGTQLGSTPAHAADVLALTIGPDGQTVYTTGIDQKITQHTLVALPSLPPRWVQTLSRRLHSHDVSSLVIFPPYSALCPPVTRTCPILVSGGLDMAAVLTPAGTPATLRTARNLLQTSRGTAWGESWQMRIPYVRPNMALVPRRRLLAVRHEARISVWWVGSEGGLRQESGERVGGGGEGREWGLGVEMELRADGGNLLCLAVGEEVSGEGVWVGASDGEEVRVWRLTGPRTALRPKRVKGLVPRLLEQLPAPATPTATPRLAASAIAFTPDSSRLLICTTPASHPPCTLLVVELKTLEVVAVFAQHAMSVRRGRAVVGRGGEGESEEGEGGAWIREVVVDATGKWAASVDVEGRCHVYDLKTLQHHSTLPTPPHPPSTLCFLPTPSSSSPTLLLALASNTLLTYALATRTLSDPRTSPAASSISARLSTRHEPIMGLSTRAHPGEGDGGGEVFLWGAGWVCRVDLLQKPEPSSSNNNQAWTTHQMMLKRKRSKAAVAGEFRPLAYAPPPPQADDGLKVRIETKYRPLAMLGFVGGRGGEGEGEGEEEMVVVERPIADVLVGGEAGWGRKKYGT